MQISQTYVYKREASFFLFSLTSWLRVKAHQARMKACSVDVFIIYTFLPLTATQTPQCVHATCQLKWKSLEAWEAEISSTVNVQREYSGEIPDEKWKTRITWSLYIYIMFTIAD